MFAFLTAASPVRVAAECMSAAGKQWSANDNFIATIAYSDGSLCSLTYTSLGSKEFPKERMEIFCDGTVIELDDYRSLKMTGRKAAAWSAAASAKANFKSSRIWPHGFATRRPMAHFTDRPAFGIASCPRSRTSAETQQPGRLIHVRDRRHRQLRQARTRR